MSNRSKTPPSSQTNTPITPITIINRSQVVNKNETHKSDNVDDSDDVWITVLSSNKRPHTQSPGSSPISKHGPCNNNNRRLSNRYSPLQINNDEIETERATEPIIHKPPPIFIKSELNYLKFCELIKNNIGSDEFSCKSSISGLRLHLNTPESYRKIVQLLVQKNVDFHTFQTKQEKPFRVVLKNLHHSTDPKFIEDELKQLGFNVKQVVNVLKNQSKTPLPMFFIDLVPQPNNNDIFKVNSICYSKVKFEVPKPNNNPIQCLRCQNFGHSKRYCNHEPRCVKCDGSHLTEACLKPVDQPPKCTLCGGAHPANYRGCPAYKNEQQRRIVNLKQRKDIHLNHNFIKLNENNLNNVNTVNNVNNVNNNVQVPIGNTQSPNTKKHSSYAYVTQHHNSENNTQNHMTTNTDSNDLTKQFSLFLTDLKSVINPLITLLTTVINKILLKND